MIEVESLHARKRTGATLPAAGYRVLRFTWRTDDATIVRRLRTVLGR